MSGTLPPVKSVTRLAPVVDRDLIRATELFARARRRRAGSGPGGQARTLDLRRGDVLFEEGADPDHLYVVEDGRIALASKSDDGRESVFALMERGDLFGEMGLLDGLGRSAEARALEPSTVVEIPYAPVRAAFEERPELLWGVVALLSRRLRNMDAALADSVFLDVTGRTAKRLLDMADGERRVHPPRHPGGAGRDGRRIPRAGEQGDRQLRAPRLDRPDRASLHDPRPRAAHPARPLITPLRKAMASRQASAASSARWAGRAASWTNPWSAPS